MQGPGFEPRIPHLFILKGELLATRLLDGKKNDKKKRCRLKANILYLRN